MNFSRTLFSPWFTRCIFAAGILVLILSVSGCSRRDDASATQTHSQSSTGSGSTPGTSTLAASWNESLQKWWQALSQPKTAKTQNQNSGATTKSVAPSQAEIAAIATRHPAWKLADALEENRAEPLQYEAIAVRSPAGGSTPEACCRAVINPA